MYDENAIGLTLFANIFGLLPTNTVLSVASRIVILTFIDFILEYFIPEYCCTS